jgi:hypothetical protein
MVVLSLAVAHGGGVVVVDDGLLWRKTIVAVVFRSMNFWTLELICKVVHGAP